MSDDLATLSERLRAGVEIGHRMHLAVGECVIRVASNDAELIDGLLSYYEPFVIAEREPDLEVTAIEARPPVLSLPFVDWPREAGKRGRKEEFANIPGGRVVRKVRTGMQFVFGEREKVAIGPCLANDNQIINFVNAQYMTWLLDRGWVLCHAAAAARAGRGMAIAGVSGGGKSTLTLHLLRDRLAFLSNDRVLVKRDGGGTRMSGIPKLPRINPGTALNHPDLRGILTAHRIRQLEQMSEAELWDLEEKYDVDIARWFDGVPFEIEDSLDALVVLNWHRESPESTALRPVDLAERRDLLAAVVKSPGPFHLPTQAISIDEDAYLRELAVVEVWEASGRVDFDYARAACLEILGAS